MNFSHFIIQLLQSMNNCCWCSHYTLICSSTAMSILIIALPKADVMCQDFLHFLCLFDFPVIFSHKLSFNGPPCFRFFSCLYLQNTSSKIMLIFCCYVTNRHKLNGLKEHPYIYVPVSVGQTSIWVWLGYRLQPSQYQNQDGGHAGVLPEGPLIKKLLTTSFQLWADFSSLLL